MNDLAWTLGETKSFDEAVAVARDFVAAHPDTLLVVTADHETGGMHMVGGVSWRLAPQELRVPPDDLRDGPQEGGVSAAVTVTMPGDYFNTMDGQTVAVNWSTFSHAAIPVGVRAAGTCSETIGRMNGRAGAGHLTDLYQALRGCLTGIGVER
jgi:alkaline phosphatase